MSAIIQTVSLIVTAATSIIAVVISVKTLKQNSKMIEESARPYVAIYYKTTCFSGTFHYLVLKNFGKTSAKITQVECTNFDLKSISHDANKIPFAHIAGHTLAPKQSMVCNVKMMSFFNSNYETLDFIIKYETEFSKYSEYFSIKPSAEADTPNVRNNTEDKELKTISYVIQDLVEKKL